LETTTGEDNSELRENNWLENVITYLVYVN